MRGICGTPGRDGTISLLLTSWRDLLTWPSDLTSWPDPFCGVAKKLTFFFYARSNFYNPVSFPATVCYSNNWRYTVHLVYMQYILENTSSLIMTSLLRFPCADESNIVRLEFPARLDAGQMRTISAFMEKVYWLAVAGYFFFFLPARVKVKVCTHGNTALDGMILDRPKHPAPWLPWGDWCYNGTNIYIIIIKRHHTEAFGPSLTHELMNARISPSCTQLVKGPPINTHTHTRTLP